MIRMKSTEAQRNLIGELLEFAERFAHQNSEPVGGHCQETIRLAQKWLEAGSATLDPVQIKADLVEYVQRYADMAGEPEGGGCRNLLERAVYRLPSAKDVSRNWDGRKQRGFEPTSSQVLVIDAVQAALGAGKFYSDEVVAYCAAFLGLSEEDRLANFDRTRVEGGMFGMDCYYARDYLQHCKDVAAEAQARTLLQLREGRALGVLVFNDGKRVTGCSVVEVRDDDTVLSGKRGSKILVLAAKATAIQHAMDRACERGFRRDDFARFVAALGATTACRPPDDGVQDVVDDVLGRAETYGFQPDDGTVREAVQESANLVGVTLTEEQLRQACDGVMAAQEQKTERQRG